jgi:hypothetical protein
MRVQHRDGIYIGTHVPPTHNLLKMTLRSESGSDPFTIEALPSQGAARVAANDVREWVLEGVQQANDSLGTHYVPVLVQFVEDDNRRPDVYVELARRIVLHAHEEPRLDVYLSTVEDVFEMGPARGCVVTPGLPAHGFSWVKVGDPVALKRPDGSTIITTVKGLELGAGQPANGCPILIGSEQSKGEVPVGTELWIGRAASPTLT